MIVAALLTGMARAAVIPPNALVDGRTYSQWTALWWKWALEIPDDGHHPLKDRTGIDALRNQSGQVWFLGWFLGPANTSSTIVRNIAVPDDKVLFIAIHGSECSTIESPPYHCSDEDTCTSCAGSVVPTDLSCEVDGVSVSNLTIFAVSSPIFDFTLPPQNIAGVPGGGAGSGVGYGTHVMIEGLSPGTLAIRFHARYPQFNVAWDVTYVITVYQRPTISFRPRPDQALIELSWSGSGFSLQQSDTLGSDASWTAASVIALETIDETQIALVASDLGSSRFFRLYKP